MYCPRYKQLYITAYILNDNILLYIFNVTYPSAVNGSQCNKHVYSYVLQFLYYSYLTSEYSYVPYKG